MKIFAILLALIAFSITVSAQEDLQKLVETERSFARFARDHGTRSAFLEYLAPDGLVFVPDKTNGIAYWKARPESPALLSWAPNYGDISSGGILGYTTGNWEYRAKGKDDIPSVFGDFVTVWLRQLDGKYKFVIDIGISHPKPDRYSEDWKTLALATRKKSTTEPTRDAVTDFYQLAATKGLSRAYETFASDGIRAYREDKFPIFGKRDVVKLLKEDKAVTAFAKRSSTFASDDISYSLNTYTKTQSGKVVEKGNFLQIWKFYGGDWHIVLDVFKPVPLN